MKWIDESVVCGHHEIKHLMHARKGKNTNVRGNAVHILNWHRDSFHYNLNLISNHLANERKPKRSKEN